MTKTLSARTVAPHRIVHALFLVLCVLVTGVSALAHDLWIEPSAFLANTTKVIAVKLRVGVDLLGDPVPRDPALIDRFIAVGRAGSKPIIGRDGEDPAGVLRVADAGLVIIGYSSKPSHIVLPAQKFNDYLTEEGLEAIAALRSKRNETNAEAREAFARCAKALISSGPITAADVDRPLGFTLELVAEKNPYGLQAGQSLPVRLLYKNQPLAGALVVAVNRRNPSAKVAARSGKDGRVTFKLAEPGMWLVKAVHMTPAPAGADAQWESFWASLTFELPGKATTPATQR
ncbi:MAG: DUF4198 domain-containing protein [Acidobacteriota bacterium]|nr:DUF4198 domain-containing protein [Acidobacteriota bacterium]